MSTIAETTEVIDDPDIIDIVEKYADDNEITEAYITDDGRVLSQDELYKIIAKHSMRCFDTERIYKENIVSKSIDGSQQSDAEIKNSMNDGVVSLSDAKVVEPPYPPEILATFLEIDETHYRCVKTKVVDAVGRDYTLAPVQTPEGEPYDPSKTDKKYDKLIAEETAEIRNFIAECNDIAGFEGVLERAVMDHEAIGWAAIEVIRSRDGKIRRLAHVPATRIKVLKRFVGFVEAINSHKLMYYQPFGRKVLSKSEKDPLTDAAEPYNPRLDGDLEPGNIEWNLVDRETGKPTNDFQKAANEILWIPKHHSNTVYYGLSDIIPSLGQLLANVHIRDYVLQFFEHNTVPRYAIIIEGGKLSDPVRDLISQYFSTHVKGQPHKTLIIPIPSTRGEVKVRFERLDATPQEAGYQETRKNNSQAIMTAHALSPAILGIADAASLGSGKGLSQAEIYKDRVVTPIQRAWDGAINKLLRLGLGVQMIALKHTPLDIRDYELEMRVLTGYLEKGTMNINEVRLDAKLGDAIEGGERYFVVTTQGLMFVDELTEAASADKQALMDEVEGMKQQAAIKQAQMLAQRQNQTAKNGKPKPSVRGAK